jgi:soluble lytic murein transglycosylase
MITLNSLKKNGFGHFLFFFGIALFLSPLSLRAQSDFFQKYRSYREKFQTFTPQEQEKKIAEIDKAFEKTQSADEKKLLKMTKAYLARLAGKNELAEQSFEELLKDKNNMAEYIHFEYGKLLVDLKKLKEAKIQFQKVLDLSPNQKLQWDSQLEIAKMDLTEKNFKRARSLLAGVERRQRGQEGYSDIIYNLALAERGVGNQRNFCRWIKKLYTKFPQYDQIASWGPQLSKDLIGDKPTNCQVSTDDRKNRIRYLQWAGLGEKASSEIESLKAAADKSESFEVDRVQISFWLHDGEVTKALQTLLPMYEAKKSDLAYLNMLAVASARSGEFQSAVGSYYRIYKLAPRGKMGKEALFQAAFLSYQFQDYDGASRKFNEFMKAFPGSGLARDAKWQLAWIRYLRGDYEGAEKSLSSLLHEKTKKRRRRPAQLVYPKDRVTYWMAMSLYRMKRMDKARPLFESLAKDPLIGYYSIAAQYRLKKIEKLTPKAPRLALINERSRWITRFTAVDTLILPEEAYLEKEESTEDSESEESIVSTALPLVEETPSDEEGEATAAVEGTPAIAGQDELQDKPSFANPLLVKRFERARDLMILGMYDWAKWDLYDIERKTSNREYLKNLMQEYTTIDNYNRSAYIAQTTFSEARGLHGIEGAKYLWEYAYPKAFPSAVNKYTKSFDVPSELVWGIMRAESNFKKEVISPVGALGLMQVMPMSAMKIAGLMGEKDFEPRKLLEPDHAVRIGARYLQRLMKKFDSSIPLVAAGYNAGPHRVTSWISNFGKLEMDEFVEHIPYLETRNYVKKVVSNYQVYNLLYGNGKKDIFSYLAEPLTVKPSSSLATKETWEDI